MTEEHKLLIRACAKDERALNELEALFSALSTRCERTRKHLWLLEQAIQNDYDSIVITDLDLSEEGPKIVYVNDGFTRMTGYSREEVLGKTPRILQGPKTERATLDRLRRNLAEGRSFFGQTINYKKDGSEFVNQWDIHPIYNEEGELTNWVSYQHDITTKKRAEDSYFEQSCEFDAMDELSKRTFVDFAPGGRVIYANKAFRALTGFDKEELTRMSIWDLVCPRHEESLREQLAMLEASGQLEGSRIKTMIRNREGLPVQVEICCHHHELNEGKLIRACVQNLSLQKRIQKTLSKRKEDLAACKNPDFTYQMAFTDGDGLHFDWVSGAFSKLTGHDTGEVLQAHGWANLVHPDDLAKVEEHLARVIDGKSTVTEYRLRVASGAYITVLDCGKPVTDPASGSVVGITGAIMDVSGHYAITL